MRPMPLLLPVLLPTVLAVTAAGCAVLPLAIGRPLPSPRVALVGIEETQQRLADSWTFYTEHFEAGATARPVAVHGATQAAYRRWVEDEVRELPDPSTSISIGGGDT